jgi:lipoate-protein ligase B
VTYHGPGQLVGYPVLNLKALCLGIKEYVFLLEEVLIGLLKDYDLPAGRRTGYPGVWVEQEKIASLGLSVQEGIAFHGFALNYRVDLEPFQWIIPCGLSGVRMTSMDRLKGGPIEAKDLRRRLAAHFEEIFNLKPVSGELEKRIVKKWLENCKKIPISSFDGNNQRDRQESENVVSHHSG